VAEGGTEGVNGEGVEGWQRLRLGADDQDEEEFHHSLLMIRKRHGDDDGMTWPSRQKKK
jgi:hypothetical protein